jgi:4-amino-4-deoxy-L-arabinose transferase-like glycosyltransferase
MSPFGWRILGVIAATAMIPLIFIFCKRLFKSALAGFFAAFLLTFDFLHFTLARLAIGEIYLLLFSILMFYFAFDYFEKREAELTTTAGVQNGRAAHSLFLFILCFGLGFAVKWLAIFGLVAVLILMLINNRRLKQPLPRDARVVLAGLLAAAAIYIAIHIPYMLSGEGHGLIDLHHLPVCTSATSPNTSLRARSPFSLRIPGPSSISSCACSAIMRALRRRIHTPHPGGPGHYCSSRSGSMQTRSTAWFQP